MCEDGIVEEGPACIPQFAVMLDAVKFEVLVENFVGRFDGEVEAKIFEEVVLIHQDRVFPAPEVLRLLVDSEIGVLLCDAAARDDEFFDFATILFDFGSEKHGGSGDLLERNVS